ncbi:unnamed protein product [Absidia cylindrospora]
MWILSTGKTVELEMKNQALACNFEHSSHSLILDVADPMWCNYFTKEELDEIKNHNVPSVPALPNGFIKYLEALRPAKTAKEADRLAYEKLSNVRDVPSYAWA